MNMGLDPGIKKQTEEGPVFWFKKIQIQSRRATGTLLWTVKTWKLNLLCNYSMASSP
jgi:hypothetical protein